MMRLFFCKYDQSLNDRCHALYLICSWWHKLRCTFFLKRMRSFQFFFYKIRSLSLINEILMSIFSAASMILIILRHFEFSVYFFMIRFLKTIFISISDAMKNTFSSFSLFRVDSWVEKSRDKTFDTICSLFDLCLMIRSKHWI